MEYYVSCLLQDKENSTLWRFIIVYGSSYDEHKLEFINELHNIYSSWQGPTLIGEYFNLIRDCSDKKMNNGNINQHLANLFNDWINKFDLIELKNVGRRFTLANNLDNLVVANIDRVFISTCWEALFPVVQLKMLPRVGSDHTPLVVNTGAIQSPKVKQFRFGKWWLEVAGFKDLVHATWNSHCPSKDPMEKWHFKVRNLRRKLRGWNSNLEASKNKHKQ